LPVIAFDTVIGALQPRLSRCSICNNG